MKETLEKIQINSMRGTQTPSLPAQWIINISI